MTENQTISISNIDVKSCLFSYQIRIFSVNNDTEGKLFMRGLLGTIYYPPLSSSFNYDAKIIVFRVIWYSEKQEYEFHMKRKVIITCQQYLREGFNKNYWYFQMGQGEHGNVYYVKKPGNFHTLVVRGVSKE